MKRSLRMAFIAAGVGAVWLLLSTIISVSFGDFLRVGLGWTEDGSGLVGIIIWLGLVVGVPAVGLGVYNYTEGD